MTDPQTALKAEFASRLLARRRLMPFIKRLNPKYLDGWVHNDICERLERFSDDVAAGKNPRLMLLMPPRHGKSEIASRNFPAWHMGRFPEHEFISCSYNLSLAMGFSRKVKQIISDSNYEQVFPGSKLDPHNQSTEEWALEGTRGGYVAAGIGGPITGKGAHVLLIDDPVKNAEEADSAGSREGVWEWYNSTAYSRLAPGGGVLVIQCMTGDTPVLMADGVERRLDSLHTGDEIATYAGGQLAKTKIRGFKSNGHDAVLKITTSSGKVVRANGRHPFLVDLNGDFKWIRARSLTTAHRIVALKGSGVSGRELLAPQRAVPYLSAAEGFALPTTTRKNGQMGRAHLVLTPLQGEKLTLSTAMASPLLATGSSLKPREGFVPSVQNPQDPTNRTTGKTSSLLTTATTQGKCAVSYATTAMQESDILEPSPWHLPQPNTSDFTLDGVISVEPDGIEEVFDLQVEDTENFIANGLVSHNTWWHDDDLSGRLQTMMREGSDDEHVDQFEVVKYPAIAEQDEYLDPQTHEIVRVNAEEPAPENRVLRLLRKAGEALHPERYDLDKLLRIKAQNKGGRWWSALYQQNPVPDDGAYFIKDQFRRGDLPSIDRTNVYIAWDFAISENKQNDYTVGSVGLQDDDDMLHIADLVRFKSGDSFFIVESILNLCKKWNSSTLTLGFEDGQIYRAIEALLKKRMRETKFYPSIMVLRPITDKVARARTLQGRMQQGMVSFSSQGTWFDGARAEMLRFPAGVHDDQVDSLAWMAQMVVNREAPRKPKVKEAPSWRNKLKMLGGSSSYMTA